VQQVASALICTIWQMFLIISKALSQRHVSSDIVKLMICAFVCTCGLTIESRALAPVPPASTTWATSCSYPSPPSPPPSPPWRFVVQGWHTPLHIAAWNGQAAVIEVLVAAGANTEALSKVR